MAETHTAPKLTDSNIAAAQRRANWLLGNRSCDALAKVYSNMSKSGSNPAYTLSIRQAVKRASKIQDRVRRWGACEKVSKMIEQQCRWGVGEAG